jgi:hypothetical protein
VDEANAVVSGVFPFAGFTVLAWMRPTPVVSG